MNISISYSGVGDHIGNIDEELRSIHLLRKKLRSLHAQAAELGMDTVRIRRCAALIESVEKSARFRRDTLMNLIADMKRADVKAGETVQDILEAIDAQAEAPAAIWRRS